MWLWFCADAFDNGDEAGFVFLLMNRIKKEDRGIDDRDDKTK